MGLSLHEPWTCGLSIVSYTCIIVNSVFEFQIGKTLTYFYISYQKKLRRVPTKIGYILKNAVHKGAICQFPVRWIITVIVVNPPKSKLAKRSSAQCFKNCRNEKVPVKFSFSEKATKIQSHHPLDLTFT